MYPSYAKGGTVKHTGLALVHKGETVMKSRKDNVKSMLSSRNESSRDNSHMMKAANSGRKKKFIAGAIKHPGALTAKAHAASESPMSFAHEHEHSPGTTGRQARLAIILQGFHK